MLGRSLIGLLAVGALAHPAGGAVPNADPAEQIVAPPATYKAGGVTVDEHLGVKLPIDATFRTLDGTTTTLGAVLGASEIPTILTFNYADCPLLCSMQLNGLTAAMPEVATLGPMAGPGPNLAFYVGVHYRIVTISLEPSESLDKLSKMRAKYLDRLPPAQRAAAERGWTFLAAETPGDGDAIRRVADAVGFKYTYISERAEWAHPAAFIFLSTAGVVTRYVYGFEISPPVMRESIFRAGLAEPTTAVGFMHTCYYYDADQNNYSHAGVMALRIGALGFLVLFIAGLGALRVIRKHGRRTGDVHPRGFRPRPPLSSREVS